MRVLDVHAERCSFAVVAAPPAEDAPDPEPPDPDPDPMTDAVPAPREGGFEDCLAAFVAVEGADARDPERVARRAADHLDRRASDLRCSRILLYPCPALSERAADHGTTVECCRALARALPDGDYDLLRAPVGWHRSLELETAGHPFGEATTRFTADASPPDRDGEWVVLTPDGERRDPADALPDLDDPTRAVLERELAAPDPVAERLATDPGDGDGARTALAEPDGLGGRRLLPAGRLVQDLLADRVRERALDLGAAPVGTAVTCDPSDPATARLLGALGASVGDGPTLRPSTRLGACAFLRDATLVPSDCPLRLFEAGPVARDGGATTVPTVHAALADRDGAWATLHEFATLARELAADCGLAAVPVCRAGAAVPPARLSALAAALDRPLAVERRPESADGDREPGADGAVTVEFHDPARAPADAPHVSLDPGLAARAGIAFDGEDDPDHPLLVDCAPLGSLDATRRALVADAKDAPFPAWLAPTVVRFVTVAAAQRDRATDLAATVSEAGLRADVDDRALPVGDRLDRAARDGVPFVVVVGEREREGSLPVGDRRAGVEWSLSVEDLVGTVGDAVGDRPRRRRYTPRFVGDGPLRGHDGRA
jgi:threonyl-tRNA synthetase